MATAESVSDARTRELERLMNEIERERDAVRDLRERSSSPQFESAAAGDEARYQLFDRTRYLEELIDELFKLMRGWHDPEPERATKGTLEAAPRGLAIVVGHDRKAPGANALAPPFAQQMRAEYVWNSELAQMIVAEAKARNIRSEIFYRDRGGVPGAYADAAAWNPQATVELHFNCYNGTVAGTETLFGAERSVPWAKALQTEMVALYKRTGVADRGLKDRSTGGRGHNSVTRIHPSALIEPFFGDHAGDAAMAVATKADLAKTILRAFTRLTGIAWVDDPQAPVTQPAPVAVAAAPGPSPAPAASPAPQPPPAASPPPAAAPTPTATPPPVAATTPSPQLPPKPANVTEKFWQLTHHYGRRQIEFPHLRGVTLAQWALETGLGKSALAEQHLNFAGMKWRNVMAPYATKVAYQAHDGLEDYCKFANYDNFIDGFWARLDLMDNYKGWRDNNRTPEDFIGFIAEIWAPKQNYAAKVLDLYRRMRAAGYFPFEATATS
jgi:hypothetical protein